MDRKRKTVNKRRISLMKEKENVFSNVNFYDEDDNILFHISGVLGKILIDGDLKQVHIDKTLDWQGNAYSFDFSRFSDEEFLKLRKCKKICFDTELEISN